MMANNTYKPLSSDPVSQGRCKEKHEKKRMNTKYQCANSRSKLVSHSEPVSSNRI